MNVSSLSAIIASVALFFLILGFVFGWLRGYQKSLTRFIIVLVVAVLVFFIAPVITKSVLEYDLASKGVSVNGKAVATVKDYIVEIICQLGPVGELVEASPTLQAFITALPSMIVNIILFTVLFFILKWFTMLIYGIFTWTIFSKKKMEGKNKIKLLGAGIGTLQAVLTIAVLFMPLFGFVNITQSISNDYTSAQTAVVVNSGLASEESETTISIDEMSNEVEKYSNAFKNTWVVKVFSGVGLDKASVAVFNSLSTQKVNGINTNLTKELKPIVKIIPHLNGLTSNSSKINAEFVSSLEALFDCAYESEVVENIVNEVVGTAATKWSDGEKFLGLEIPKFGDDEKLNEIIKNAFGELKNSATQTLKKDIVAVCNVLEILTEEKVIGDNANEDILSALSKNDTLGDVITEALESPTLKAVMPELLNYGLDYAYDQLGITYTEAEKADYIITKTADEINWSQETGKIQKIFNNALAVIDNYKTDYVKYNENKSEEEKKDVIEVIDFEKIGIALDSMRESELFRKPGYQLLNNVLGREEIAKVIGNKETVGTAGYTIINDWNTPTSKYQATFASLKEMVDLSAKFADSSSAGNPTKEDISTVLEILADEDVNSNIIQSIVSEENLGNLGLDSDMQTVISDVTTEITNQLQNSENKEDEIKGIASVVEIISNAQNVQGEDDKISLDETNANKLIEDIEGSEIIKGLIENPESVGQVDISEKIDEDTKTNLSNAIGASGLTAEQKTALLNMLVNGQPPQPPIE